MVPIMGNKINNDLFGMIVSNVYIKLMLKLVHCFDLTDTVPGEFSTGAY